MRITRKDYIKANKIANRQLISYYNPTTIHQSKKTYSRRLKHKKGLD
jgi:hypothetical protein